MDTVFDGTFTQREKTLKSNDLHKKCVEKVDKCNENTSYRFFVKMRKRVVLIAGSLMEGGHLQNHWKI